MRTGNSGQNISIKFFSRKNKKFSLHNQYLKSTIKWIYLIGIYTCVSKKKEKKRRSTGDLSSGGERSSRMT